MVDGKTFHSELFPLVEALGSLCNNALRSFLVLPVSGTADLF